MSNFILASTETCLCSECKIINSPSVQSSILKPVKFVDKLLPFPCQLNNQNLEQSIIEYDQVKCSKLKRNLAMNLISKSISVCLDKEIFSFQNEKILVLNIFMATNQFCVKINKNKLEFSNINPIKFNSQQIQQFDLNFLSDQQLSPAYSINELHQRYC